MRKKLTKVERKRVYDKCNGHCAYCGCELEYKNMQVDHARPLKIGGADEIENMLPACRSCNHYKATLDVEGFRRYLAGIAHRLMRDSIPFQVATRFGIVKHMGDSVTFYFETLGIELTEDRY
ncbi:MAG: HNH endonuclease [Lachnospiraceae bacterium]|nr:HNH endonuclease [Lachnospiraceae bacterium]